MNLPHSTTFTVSHRFCLSCFHFHSFLCLFWFLLLIPLWFVSYSNIWWLNNTLLNNQQITEEIKKEIKICIETNENENTTTQNVWGTVKVVQRGRVIAIQAYLKKQEKSQINNLTLHLRQLEKEEMKNPRVSRRKEILKLSRNKCKRNKRDHSKNQQNQKLVFWKDK